MPHLFLPILRPLGLLSVKVLSVLPYRHRESANGKGGNSHGFGRQAVIRFRIAADGERTTGNLLPVIGIARGPEARLAGLIQRFGGIDTGFEADTAGFALLEDCHHHITQVGVCHFRRLA